MKSAIILALFGTAMFTIAVACGVPERWAAVGLLVAAAVPLCRNPGRREP